MQDLVKIIEASSLLLISADTSDLTELGTLHSNFKLIRTTAEKMTDQPPTSVESIKTTSAAVADLIEKVILQEVEDASEALGAINSATETLQSLINDLSQGKTDTILNFHPLLHLESANQSPKSESKDFQLPENVDEDIFGEFISNQPHVLENLETAILDTERDGQDENLGAVKAILHSIKGETGLMGLEDMASACHDAESLIEEEKENFPAEKLLEMKDWLLSRVNQMTGSPTSSQGKTQDTGWIKEAITELNGSESDETATQEEEPCNPSSEEPEQADSITIAEGDVPLVMDFIGEAIEHLTSGETDLLSLEENPDDDETINSIFRGFHTIKGVAGFLNLQQIQSLAHASENLLDLARKGELVLGGTSVDVIFEAIDVMGKMIESLRTAVENSEPVVSYQGLNTVIERITSCATGKPLEPRVGEILAAQTDATGPEIREALKEQSKSQTHKKVGEVLVDKGIVSEQQVDQALKTQKAKSTTPATLSRTTNKAKKITTESTVKVTTNRLDSMIDMVGELVIAQSMVTQDIEGDLSANERLERNVRHLTKITRDLQDLSMSMRMVPVQGVFQKMARLVRDLARKSNKEIEFIMVGADTEMDRNVVEAIADPLVHMVRNSADHGIETTEERRQTQKNPTGKIELKAYHQGGNIVIEINDDGRGLNRDKILSKAIKNGIVKKGQELSDQEINMLIFHAGLSTAEKVTDVSGRGVGMDVVRKNIESLRGRIEIESEPGEGSRFRISLPLTLAVIDGQIVTVGEERFIIPTISIEQSLRPQPEQISTIQGRGEIMKIRERILPLVRLHNLFNIKPNFTDPSEGIVVIIDDGDQRCCLLVDTLESQQQVVIKSLGEFFGKINGVSGGAIMGDGNISLIIDVPGLIKKSTQS